jgi:sister chromatid cohesion protein DCC1
MEKAKLNKNELEPLIQHIYLGSSVLANEEYKLLEMDEEKLNYLLDGNSLIIRGGETDNVVCCTSDSTFSFKVAEISNPLLVSSDLILSGHADEQTSSNSEIVFMTNSYFMMAKEKPKLQKIKNLLELNLYSGRAYEQSEAKKFTINDFLDLIQASEAEIYNYLNYIQAFQIDGYWRLLDFKYFNQILDNVLKIIDEKCWTLDKIPAKEIYQELDSIYDM